MPLKFLHFIFLFDFILYSDTCGSCNFIQSFFTFISRTRLLFFSCFSAAVSVLLFYNKVEQICRFHLHVNIRIFRIKNHTLVDGVHFACNTIFKEFPIAFSIHQCKRTQKLLKIIHTIKFSCFCKIIFAAITMKRAEKEEKQPQIIHFPAGVFHLMKLCANLCLSEKKEKIIFFKATKLCNERMANCTEPEHFAFTSLIVVSEWILQLQHRPIDVGVKHKSKYFRRWTIG